jgi:4-hydroxythreonine-4-phosphate dehydrogenase
MTPTPPRLCITMGDPAGIGPEIVLKALARLAPRVAAGELALQVAGSAAVLRATAERFGLPVPGAWPQGVTLIDIGPPRETFAIGAPSAESGRIAYACVEGAVRAVLGETADAIVTAPLSKEGLHLAGKPYPGHTELLTELTGGSGAVMMLAHGPFRVSHLTTHIPLEAVPARLTPERLRRVIDLTYVTLRRLGIDRPRLAVAALNPHAGEGGILGRQDIDITAPLTAGYRDRGLSVDGPVPGDTVFVKMRGGSYDAVVAMYHDQGHIPVKLLGFSVDPATGRWEAVSGVNITLGLPIIRTSVDHGTAYDIAGMGVANETSLIEAIDYAAVLAKRREVPNGVGAGAREA